MREISPILFKLLLDFPLLTTEGIYNLYIVIKPIPREEPVFK